MMEIPVEKESWCLGRESNPHLSLRSALFCPLNYRGAHEIITSGLRQKLPIKGSKREINISWGSPGL